MDFSLTEREAHYRDRVRDFIETHVRGRTADYKKQIATGDRWQPVEVIEELKPKAKAAGLWNFFMPPGGALAHVDESFEFRGTQLTNLEYALCAEEMGRILWSAEVFNCSAPDTGNMEVLHRYGTREQKERWLTPLMNGEIRSAFLMTEPGVASSDATNIQCEIRRDGDEYVINGRKWWSSGAGDPRCKVAIVMGKTNPDNRRHQQQSMVLVPLDAPGITVERALTVYGYDDAPHGHMEIELKDVRIPASNMHRDVAPPLPQGGRHDGQGRQQGRQARDRDDQGLCAANGAQDHRRRRPGPWRRRRQPGFQPRSQLGRHPHLAPRRRP
jgi:acyl-CoA dehydrogenase